MQFDLGTIARMKSLHRTTRQVPFQGGQTRITRSFTSLNGCNHRTIARSERGPVEPSERGETLVEVIKRKQNELQEQMRELGEEAVEERLKSVQEVPPSDPHKLVRMIAECTMMGRPALIVEACRGPGVETVEELAAHARLLVQAGADAIVVRTDSVDTQSGYSDLFAVCQAVKVPVLRRDWIIHPLQLVDARTAGAAGCIGIVTSIMNRATAVLSSFSAAIGLDCPVEIVNTAELNEMEKDGVPFYGLNLSVGLSIGFGSQIAQGLVKDLPFGAVSMIGVKSLEDAKAARLAGADSLLIKKEAFEGRQGKEAQFIDMLKMVTDGDD